MSRKSRRAHEVSMVLAAPVRTLEKDPGPAPVPPGSDKFDRTGSFLGREGSQTWWEVPGFPTLIWWWSCPPHPTPLVISWCHQTLPPHLQGEDGKR